MYLKWLSKCNLLVDNKIWSSSSESINGIHPMSSAVSNGSWQLLSLVKELLSFPSEKQCGSANRSLVFCSSVSRSKRSLVAGLLKLAVFYVVTCFFIEIGIINKRDHMWQGCSIILCGTSFQILLLRYYRPFFSPPYFGYPKSRYCVTLQSSVLKLVCCLRSPSQPKYLNIRGGIVGTSLIPQNYNWGFQKMQVWKTDKSQLIESACWCLR